MERRIRSGFRFSAIATLIGVALRVAAPHLSWDPLGSGAWSKNEETQGMLIQLSLGAIAFGLAAFVVTLNRWLHMEDSQA